MRAPALHALIASLLLAGPAAAHAVWLEDAGQDAVRVYLGEPAQPAPEGGDPEFSKLQAPLVFTGEARTPAPLVRKADHIQAGISARGDVRLVDGKVFAPWRTREGGHEGAVFYARLGRTETRALLDLELTPVDPGADAFVVTFRGRPLPGAAVQVIDPEQWSKTLKADAAGRIQAPSGKRGRYILEVSHAEAGPFEVGGVALAKLHHVSTLTFQRP